MIQISLIPIYLSLALCGAFCFVKKRKNTAVHITEMLCAAAS